jgi:hypothetical protein
MVQHAGFLGEGKQVSRITPVSDSRQTINGSGHFGDDTRF